MCVKLPSLWWPYFRAYVTVAALNLATSSGRTRLRSFTSMPYALARCPARSGVEPAHRMSWVHLGPGGLPAGRRPRSARHVQRSGRFRTRCRRSGADGAFAALTAVRP